MTQRARKSRRRSRGSAGKKVLLGFGVLLILLLVGVASVGAWVLNVWNSAPSIDTLKPIDQGETSSVYAADGSLLGYIEDDVIREPVDLKEIPKTLRQATVAIEDEGFFEHDGVDYEAIVRAAVENVEAGEIRQGGSTITQQLVRNLYIADPDDTIERKIREAKLATELEEERTKGWILKQYLNTSPYGTNNGRTAVGVEAAAQVYFSKHVSDLNLWEAALIAGMPQAPSQYNPLLSPGAAKRRRNQVLRRMYAEGYITRHQKRNAVRRDFGLDRGYKYETIREPYFFAYVEQELIDRYGVNTVRQGGLEVHTTIQPGLQELAHQAAVNQAAVLGGPSVALASVDPSNGHIVAMASSASFESSQYNLAAQGHRQPGSAFKPFVLTTALKQGIDPDSTYYSGESPTTLYPYGEYGEAWPVNNAEGGSAGTMSLTSATTGSVNVIYAKLGIDVGPENTAETAHDLGIQTPLDGVAAEAIGGLTIGVSPLEMANAYATFASGGVRHDATAIAKVEFPNGEVDETEQSEGVRVISDGIAYEVTRILKTVLVSGTAAGLGVPGCPSAGKTGTTDLQADAWFVGYTPTLSTAVWVGYPGARVPMPGAYGGTYAAPAWNEFMTAATPTCDDFPEPTDIPELSSYTSEYTASPEPETYDSDYDSDYSAPAPTDTGTDTDTSTDEGTDSGAYNTEQFQAGADPAGGD
jgi:penicillin-binding protein 1A